MENALLVAALAGVTELYKRLVAKDFATAGLIAVASLAGAILAPAAGEMDWFAGMLAGFAASGVVTVVSYVRK